MKKSILVILLAAVAIVAYSGDKKEIVPKVYGKIMLSYGVEDIQSQDAWELKSHASRVGVKGSFPISDSLKAIYQLEFEVDVTDSSKSSADHIKARNQFFGLSGAFGTIIAGRHDAPIKMAQGKFDLFNDLDGDIKTLSSSEIRTNNVVAYTTPKFGGVANAMVAVVPGEDAGNQDGPADTVYANVIASKDGWFGSIGFLDTDSRTALRGVVYYKNDVFQAGVLYDTDDPGETDGDAFIVNGAYFLDKVTLKAQYGQSDIKGISDPSKLGKDVLSVGLDYKLAKNAALFTYITTMDDDGNHDEKFYKVGGVVKF